MTDKTYDIFVIGGGINGCGIARDAAGRGLSVFLAEKDDIGSGASSAASKLLDGGLRHLEQHDFRPLRHALAEREILLEVAPHLVRPARLILPYREGLRPAWLTRIELFLYDHLGGHKHLRPSKTLNLAKDVGGEALKTEFTRGFEYSDCWVDDARLVLVNALDAAGRGASVNPRTTVVSATRTQGLWRVELVSSEGDALPPVQARALINAAGPWANRVLQTLEPEAAGERVALIKGSHIVVRRLFAHDRAYALHDAEGRIVFALPYEDDFTLIGASEVAFEGDPSDVAFNSAEIGYLCNVASAYFARPVTREQIVWGFSGIRPKYDDHELPLQQHIVKYDEPEAGAPLVNIFGGRLTTYRAVAEEILDRLAPRLQTEGGPWTAKAPLPGGDFAVEDFEAECQGLQADYPFLTTIDARRLFRLYGTRARALLGEAKTAVALGENFGSGLTAREVDYLLEEEWAETLEDILWRRTKVGLRIGSRDLRALEAYLARKEKRVAVV